MQQSNRHNKILNRLLVIPALPLLKLRFGFSFKKEKLNGPTLVVCNHVTNYDPLLLSVCFPWDHMHFVASEHLFRLGLASKALCYIFDPIPRRKGASGADTAMACVRKLRDGRSVCLFAEGECSWDGLTNDIFPATGRLARMGNATLITYRLEGGYLTAPRWGKGIRKGKMTGHIVGVYSPEELKAMDKDAITDLIQRDLFYDTWVAQKQEPVAYPHPRRAENLQTVLYGCPHCNRIGMLSSHKTQLRCACGTHWEFTEFGTFSPAEPFENLQQWDSWQTQLLQRQLDAGTLSLTDTGISMYALEENHQQRLIATGDLHLAGDRLICGHEHLVLTEITDMALVQSRSLLVSVGTQYYQFKADNPTCLRKYLAAWKHSLRHAATADVS